QHTKNKITTQKERSPNRNDIQERALTLKPRRRKRDRPQAEKDTLNLDLIEEAGLRKKLRMDLDSIDQVAALGDVEAINTVSSSDIEPRNNSLQGEGKLEANEGARTIMPSMSHDPLSCEEGLQVQIIHELTQNVETDNNSFNQSNHSKETPVRESSTETTH
ncbi:15700_t:CDS:2, partial [Gigaspora rosea]